MVLKSLNSSQLDMRVNFMLDPLFVKKYVCLRNYSQTCLNTRMFIHSQLVIDAIFSVKTKDVWTTMG